MKKILFLLVFCATSMSLLALPTITQPPANQVLAMGGTLTLNVTASGDAPFAYQWFKDSRLLLGATNSTLTIPNAGMTNSGAYYVVVTNMSGMVISPPASVAVGNPSLLAWGNNQWGQLGNGAVNGNFFVPNLVASNVVAAAAGANHSLFVTTDGTLWAAGEGWEGQLGNGTSFYYQTPLDVTSNVVAVAAGNQHSLFVTSDGMLWTMGLNGNGQLGNGTTDNTSMQLTVASNVVAVAAGGYHSLFLESDGTLWAMGYNGFGQLGNGTTNDSTLPVRVASNVVAVAAGGYHSFFLKSDKTLWAMGRNDYGQLGDGTTNNALSPVGVASNVMAVAGGGYHSLFVTASARLWVMGENNYGQLGNGTTNNALTPISVASNVVAVAAGENHSLFATSDGTVWAMGYNGQGQLGNGTYGSYNPVPTDVPPFTIATLCPADQAYHCLALGFNFQATVTLDNLNPTYDGRAKSVTATTTPSELTVVLTYDGSVNAPTNAGSYIVVGTIIDSHYFGSVTNTLVINPNASVTLGNLNQAYTGSAISVLASTIPPGLKVNLTYNGSPTTPTYVGNYTVTGNIDDPNYQGSATATLSIVPAGLTNRMVAFGGTITLNVTTGEGTPWFYQWFKDGRLIVGATSSMLMITNAEIYDTGTYSVLATNGSEMVISPPALVMVGNPTLLAWGLNGNGQLGNGSTTNSSQPVAVATNVITAAVGQSHSLFVTSDGRLWAMGFNYFGQLGDGTTNDTSVPISVASNVVAVAAGENHSLFVTSDGTLWAMGYNYQGQLGNGTNTDSHTPVMVAGDVVAVTAGENYSLFVTGDGTLWAMGDNFWGQLGDGTTGSTYTAPIRVASNVVMVAAGYAYSLFIKMDETLWGMGYGFWGQLGVADHGNWNPTPGSVASNVVEAAAGGNHSLFVTDDGMLWTMGCNTHGQLGDGSTDYPYLLKQMPGGVASSVLMAAGGINHSLFVRNDGSLWSMGNNGYGQLGYSTNADIVTPLGVPLLAVTKAFSSGVANHSLGVGVIQSPASITLGNLNQFYTGSPISVTASTAPPGLKVKFTYNGSSVAPTKSGHYTVIGTIDDWNYQGRATNTLVITGFTLAGPTNQVLAVGDTLTLNVTANGDAPLAYQWFKDGRMLLGATNGTFTLPNAGVINSGAYYVVVTNVSGTEISLPALVSVGSPSLLAWGYNGNGQLGNGSLSDSLTPINVASNVIIGAAGNAHSLFVTEDGTLSAMGADWVGQLGSGTPNYTNRPVTVASNVVAVAAGTGFSFFIMNDGTLWAMGMNTYGQLGNGTTSEEDLPVNVASNVVAVVAGQNHALFLMTDGSLWAMGYNNIGQLGNGTMNNASMPVLIASDVVAATAGGSHSMFVTTDGKLWAMGNNSYGQLGVGATGNANLPVCVASNVMEAAAGGFHSMFVTTNGVLWAMGRNNYGQLGNGTTSNTNLPISVASNVMAVAAGQYHSLFVKTDATLWSMGENNDGQLGNGTSGNNAALSPIYIPQPAIGTIFPMDEANHALAPGYLKAPASVTLSNLVQVYTGGAVGVAATTMPPGLTVNLTYNGSTTMPTNAGIYIVLATISDPNYYGSMTSTLVITLIASGPTNQIAAQGGNLNLAVTVVGTATSYQWFKDSRLLLGATNSTLTVTNAGVINSGTYYVMVTNTSHYCPGIERGDYQKV